MSLSSHANNRKNHILVLGEGDTFGINESLGALEKKSGLTLTWKSRNSVSVCVRLVIIAIYLLMEKKSLTLKSIMELSTF